jgi:hypothetical protein
MSRRARTELDWEVISAAPISDVLHQEVEAQVEAWSQADRRLLGELMEDAGTELAREMLLRALAAGHTAAELHAFADAIRGMEDAALYAACAVDAAADLPVAHRLRAQSDPLFALELNGRPLSPRLEDDPGPAYESADGRPRPRFRAPPALFVKDERETFEASLARGTPLRARELGASEGDAPSFGRKPPPPAPSATVPSSSGRSFLDEAGLPFGFGFREMPVDAGRLTLEKALEAAAKSLAAGMPVPAALGRRAGEQGRWVLILQFATTARARAFQLHDPFAGETVWANERDLLARNELPFSAKTFRRITAVALPIGAKGEGR